MIICPCPFRFAIFVAKFINFYFFCVSSKGTNDFTSVFTLNSYSCFPYVFTVFFTCSCYCVFFRIYCNLIFLRCITTHCTFYICYSCFILTSTFSISVFLFFPFNFACVLMLTLFTCNFYFCCISCASICFTICNIYCRCTIFILTVSRNCCLLWINWC